MISAHETGIQRKRDETLYTLHWLRTIEYFGGEYGSKIFKSLSIIAPFLACLKAEIKERADLGLVERTLDDFVQLVSLVVSSGEEENKREAIEEIRGSYPYVYIGFV